VKGIDTSKRARWLVLQGVVISFVLIVTSFAGLMAEGEEIAGDGERDQAPLYTAGYAGAWDKEVGVEYVANYPGTSSDLPNARNNAYGFYNYLRWYGGACTVGHCYLWGDSNAWEEDFKRHDLGGTNNYWADSVDIVFYEGHGWPGGFTFKTPTGYGTHDDSSLTYTDARMAWGDSDLDYVALLSCSVLADSHVYDWRATMNGLNLLLGFKTTAYDVRNFGAKFAWNLAVGYQVRTAWFKACDTHQPAGVVARVLAEDWRNYYDRWTSYRYQMPRDGGLSYTTHNCGSVSPLVSANLVTAAEPGKVTEVMPVFATPALSLDEQRAEWASLTGAFEVPNRAVRVSALSATGTYSTSIVEGRELEMDQANGLFYYVDHNLLYTMTTPSRVQTISAASAKDIADQFLADNGLMPGDALFTKVMTEGATAMETVTDTLGLQSSRVLAETVTDYQVFYSRVLTYTTETIQDGKVVQQVETIPVVGPGSKLKVYVSAGGGAARVASAGAEGAIVGAMGGWRGIDEKAGQRAIQSTVTILPYAIMEKLFEQLEPQVALEQVPFNDPTQKEILGHTVGVWEEPTGAGQAELYPAYIMNARYQGDVETSPGITQTVVVTDYTYLPANEEYMRPLARIDAHSDLSVIYAPGQVITATAADASLTLAELGYHSSLTFTMGSGDYTYDWYLGSVADDNHIDSGRNLEHTITIPSDTGHAVPVPQTVILVVTDILTAHSAQDTSNASIDVSVMAPVFLPLVLRN